MRSCGSKRVGGVAVIRFKVLVICHDSLMPDMSTKMDMDLNFWDLALILGLGLRLTEILDLK